MNAKSNLDRFGRACLTALLILAASYAAAAGPYPDRFVWVFGWGLSNQKDTDALTNLLETAAASGLNGAVLSANLDLLCQRDTNGLRQLEVVRQTCARLGLELIPSVFSVGYGGGALSHNRHLAEGLPVTDAPFLCQQSEARIVPDSTGLILNGGFEQFAGNKASGFGFHDLPGVISLVDTQMVHSGKASMRLENFGAHEARNGRIMQRLSVQPYRAYRMSVWIKTEDLKPINGLRVAVLAGDKDLAPRTFDVSATMDWRKLTLVFNSREFHSVNAYVGVWGGQGGQVWVDDWTCEQIGPLNVLRRPGTPSSVRSEDGLIAYAEGVDFQPLVDPDFSFDRLDRPAPALHLTRGSRIQEGQQLRVSWYHPMLIHDSQVTVCMAEPELYDIYDHEAALLAKYLRPKRVLLNMDEVRMGGTCERCRGKDMAALLGDCLTRQSAILRRHIPGAEIYVWSDMLDPHHNAHGNYYLVQGDFTGSWHHVPKDLRIAVWGGAPRRQSLEFFEKEGFQTLIACYYDADDLREVNEWLEVARLFSNVRGCMYTPWLRKYEWLPDFGRLLRNETRTEP